MIFLCPKAFSSQDGDSHERDFLKYHLSVKKKKARIANETWETFRYKLLKDSTNQEGALDFIAECRGVFEPESMILRPDFQEKDPIMEYSLSDLVEKTKDFLKRNWADIDVFITQEPQLYKEICEAYHIPLMNLREFSIDCMNKDGGRDIYENFLGKVLREKADF